MAKKESPKTDTNITDDNDVNSLNSQKLPNTQQSFSKQTLIIAVLSTALACFLIAFAIFWFTGVVKIGDPRPSNSTRKNADSSKDKQRPNKDSSNKRDDDSRSEMIDNPNPRVTVDGNLIEVKNLEFYLPHKFEAASKGKNGKYSYALTNDDGWAEVSVYTERSSKTPEQYLEWINNQLSITNNNYEMNGTSWVQGETSNSLAFATKIDDRIYAVYYLVKLDSAATSEAMSMIPKTLYMKKIPKSE